MLFRSCEMDGTIGNRMKLLVLGLNYAPEPVGIGPFTTGLAEGMAARGHAVTVVAGQPYYPQWRAYPGQPAHAEPRLENGVSVIRVPHHVPETPSLTGRLRHYLTFARAARGPMRAAARTSPDLVLTVAPALFAVPEARSAARLAAAPLWVHLQDFEADAMFATGLLGRAPLAERAALALERRLLLPAERISTISPQMGARLLQKGVPADTVFELRNWSTLASAGSGDGSAYRREWQLGDRHVALYSGNIARKQGIEIVIEAARRLSHRDDIVFVICGEGPNQAHLAELAVDLPNVRLQPLQPAERLADLLALAAVHLLPQIADAADLVLPSKLANMLASGRPVVATAAPGTGIHAEVDGCGLATPPGEPEPFAAAIAALVDDPDRREKLGLAAQARARQRWTRAAVLDRFERAALEMIGHG
jgi:colanic acid biosynthesis glycosyl transferase WcaI